MTTYQAKHSTTSSRCRRPPIGSGEEGARNTNKEAISATVITPVISEYQLEMRHVGSRCHCQPPMKNTMSGERKARRKPPIQCTSTVVGSSVKMPPLMIPIPDSMRRTRQATSHLLLI